jgi:hypothetical protein
MKKLLIIILVCISIIKLHSQESDNIECKDGEEQAFIDFSKGIYVYGNYIGISSIKKDYEFEKYYQIYLKSTFNIQTTNTGCTSSLEELCYLYAIDSLLGEKYKYGKSFFKVNRKIQQQQFRKLSNKKKAKLLDDKKFYNHSFLEKEPTFKGGKTKLHEYFKDYFKLDNYENSFGVEFRIDNIGNIIDFEVFYPEILRDKKINEKTNIIKELNKLGKWKSGKIYNENVNSIFIMRI